jgi:NitT/TauT family transport system substrate-binding protein
MQEIISFVARTAKACAVVSAIALAGSLAPASAQQPLKKIVMAAGGDGLHYSAIHIANGAGFFKEEGLDLEIVDVNSGPRQTAALMGGSALFAPLGMIHEIKINAEGGKLVAASNLFAILDMHIVLSKDAIAKTGIKQSMSVDEKIKRMKDLRFGITSPGSTTDTAIRTMLKSRGVDPDQALRLQPVGGGSNMLAALEKGTIDGFIWSAPQPQVAAERGIAEIIIEPFGGKVTEMNDVPYLVMAVNGETIKQNEADIRGTIRALTKAMKFAHERPDDALKIVAAHFPNFDQNILKQVWKNYVKGVPSTPVISKALFDNTQTWLNVTAAKKYNTKYEDVVYNDMAAKVAKDLLGK